MDIPLIKSFTLLGLCLLVLILFISPLLFKPFRKRRMQKLANKLGLKYQTKEEISLKEKLSRLNRRTNLITGVFRGKEFYIYDVDTTGFVIFSQGEYGTFRFTVINGKNYRNLILPYFSTKKIEAMLLKNKIYPETNLARRDLIVIVFLAILFSFFFFL